MGHWGADVNCCGVMDLMVKGVAHWLFGRGPNWHCPHRRRANHR